MSSHRWNCLLLNRLESNASYKEGLQKGGRFVNLKVALLVGVVAAFASPALAQQWYVGLYAHDVTFVGNALGMGAAGREDGVDLHLGLRSKRITALEVLGAPQAHAYVSINSNRTSDFVAMGFNWPITLVGNLYLRPGFGLGYTDGKAGLPPANVPGLSPDELARRRTLYFTRIDFGSRMLFNPEIALGYRFNDRLATELSYTHLSNGQIFHHGKNQGLDDAGIRLVYSF